MGKGLAFRDSHPNGVGSKRIFAYIFCRRTTKCDVVTHVGERRVSWSQPRLPFKESRVPGSPIFRSVFMHAAFLLLPIQAPTQCRVISRCSETVRDMATGPRKCRTAKFCTIAHHMGRGAYLGGQPRHCICTNVSRGLLVIAEFL